MRTPEVKEILGIDKFYLRQMKELTGGAEFDLGHLPEEVLELFMQAKQDIIMNAMGVMYGIYLRAYRGNAGKATIEFADFVSRCCSDVISVYDSMPTKDEFTAFRNRKLRAD